MMWKEIKNTTVVMALFLVICSCSLLKNSRYESRVSAYSVSTKAEFSRWYYIAIPVVMGTESETVGNTITKRVGYFVLRPALLYDYRFKDKMSEEDFANKMLAMLIREDPLFVTEKDLDQFKDYLISQEHADEYASMNSKKLLKIHAKGSFLPNIFPDKPDYIGRCVIFNLVTNGYTVKPEDETGYLVYFKYK